MELVSDFMSFSGQLDNAVHLPGLSFVLLHLNHLRFLEMLVVVHSFMVVLVYSITGTVWVIPYALTRPVEVFCLLELLFRIEALLCRQHRIQHVQLVV